MFFQDSRSLAKKPLLLALSSVLATSTFFSASAFAQTPQSNDDWFKAGQSQIAQAKKNKPITGKAKNVILFIGDGMSVGTITAARILAGQEKGHAGEETILNMETLPHMALAKTYNTDYQTPDSAGTASAMVTGVKTKSGVISVNDNVMRGFCNTVKGNEAQTLFEMAGEQGKGLGVVSTARITHATPATAYAHTADRNWENDTMLPNIAKNQGCVDIAKQLVEFKAGDGLNVVFGGGRREFLPETVKDPEYPEQTGKRKDGQNLIETWQQKHEDGKYVMDKAGFDQITADDKYVLGLFEPSHMQYEADRSDNEPSLADMTSKAIDILSKDKDGYVMMVEAGRIDHAHHAGNAARALKDTIAYDEAIKVALEKTNPEDTLIIVTADHAHTMILNGYAKRGASILGLSGEKDANGNPYPTISYGNGPGGFEDNLKKKPSASIVNQIDYIQPALIPLESETHSQEDVAIFARGPQAWLFQGAVEQNYIFHVINEATGLADL